MSAAVVPPPAPGILGPVLSIVSNMVVRLNKLLQAALAIITQDVSTPRQWTWMAVALATGYVLGRQSPFWQRYTRVTDIPRSRFAPKILWGRAVSVSDGDTIRFLHQPTPFHPRRLGKGQKASELALPIRICTIDTPETPKFGKPGQPFGMEAKEALQELIQGRKIGLRLLQLDQYSRAVAQVLVPRTFRSPLHVDQYMLQQGLAEVYTGGGAVYGPLGVDAYLELQKKAQKAKKGIWSQGKRRESAAEYKRRTK